jgi:hypothetical protein
LDLQWTDSRVESIELTYDEVRIAIEEESGSGNIRVVHAMGPIGIQEVGIWDETTIEGATITDDHPFAATCLESMRARPEYRFESGSPTRNERRFKTLEIRLIDSSVILVAAGTFEVEPR